MKKKLLSITCLIVMLLANATIQSIANTSIKQYNVDTEEKVISRIMPETTIDEFKTQTDAQIKIYKDESKQQEVKTGLIGTGMKVVNTSDDEYTVSVIGDLNGDGKATQVELTNIIRHIVGIESAKLTGIKYKSADITGDNIVDQRDITKLVKYIVTGKLEISENNEPIEGNIEFKNIEWKTGKAQITISTDSNYKIEYQVNSTTGTWIRVDESASVDVKNLNNNDIVYARLTNGINVSETKQKRIEDTTAPIVTLTLSEITASGAKASVGAKDDESGIAEDAVYTFYIKKTSEDDSKYAKKQATVSAEWIIVDLEQDTSYTIKVEVSDVAGNKATATKDFSTITDTKLVTSITLSETKLEMIKGFEKTLTVYIKPTDATNKQIKWTSSNEKVAKVDENGKITAIADGTATITVTAQDGSGKTASCEVTVKGLEDGEYIDYPVDLNGDGDTTNDWMIFYKADGNAEGEQTGGAYENNIGDYYIIAAKHLKNTDNRLKLQQLGNVTKTGENSFSWINSSDVPSMQKTGQESLTVNGRNKTNTTINKLFMQNKYGSLNSSYIGSRVVSSLINTENWTEYVDKTYADYAIGSPTLEMLIASWNAIYAKQLKLYTNTETMGYYIGTGSNNTTGTYQSIASVANNSKLFISDSKGGYWLSSPAAEFDNYVMNMYCYNGAIDSSDIATSVSAGLRPVVHLKSGTKLNKNEETGVWEIQREQEKIEAKVSFRDVIWSDGKASVEITTNTGYTIEYQINGMAEGKWVKASAAGANVTVSNLSNNDLVYARLTNGTTAGDYANVTIADTQKPKVTSATATSNSITFSAQDKESGIVGYSVTTSNTAPTNFETVTNTQTLTNKTITDLTSDTTYYIWIKDEAGNISAEYKIVAKQSKIGNIVESISAANFGDTIEYSANGVTDWKIFYNDGNNVFIIASDYLETNKLPQSLDAKSTGYDVYWESFSKTSVANIGSNIANKYMLSWYKDNSTSTNNSALAVAELLDTDAWNSFVDTKYAENAVGSPTLEMWIASWNAKNYTNLYTQYDENGYYIGMNRKPTDTFVSLVSESGVSDQLFFPEMTYLKGYWLSSTSADDDFELVKVNTQTSAITWDSHSVYSNGVRPVVCLKSDAKVTNTNGVWKFEDESEANAPTGD